jgi:hypothetical protein
MDIVLTNQERNVIPRWRDFESTVALGELGIKAALSPRSMSIGGISNLVVDFERNHTISFAADLISAALVTSQQSLGHQAAEFVISELDDSPRNRPLLAMAHSVLGRPALSSMQDTQTTGALFNMVQSRISKLREHLRSFPQDAIGWVDLSLLFARRGLSVKACKAMLAALGLEPANRFVLRSAARLFLHIGDLERAWELLARSPLLRSDPWVSSAEIAVSLSVKRPPRSVNYGNAALKAGNFNPHDTTELAVALATLEWRAGNNRNARRFLRLGLDAPNENSLAQANHIAKDLQGSGIDTRVELFPVERPFEVSFAQAYQRGDWETAASSAVAWLNDQPFSSRPALAAGYIFSSILDDFPNGEKITKQGQIANPKDALFNVQLAYIYASTNRTDKAREELARIRTSELKDKELFIQANQGLIAYREGDIATGRQFYLEAVKAARKSANVRLEAQALLFWAREEILARTNAENDILKAAEGPVRLSDAAEAQFLLDKMKALASTTANMPYTALPFPKPPPALG